MVRLNEKSDFFVQEYDRASYSRRRIDVWREWKRNDTFAAHTSDGDDEGPYSLHLQASRKFQEHLYRWVFFFQFSFFASFTSLSKKSQAWYFRIDTEKKIEETLDFLSFYPTESQIWIISMLSSKEERLNI